MGEITKIYLSSKIPLTPEQEVECLRDIKEKTKIGFLIEIQKDVMAHTSEETFMFTVRKIEPKNRFYGAVDKDTVFEIMHEDAVSFLPQIPKLDEVGQLSNEAILDLTEVDRLKPFINELETLRLKYNISWNCLHWLVMAIDDFGKETAPHL